VTPPPPVQLFPAGGEDLPEGLLTRLAERLTELLDVPVSVESAPPWLPRPNDPPADSHESLLDSVPDAVAGGGTWLVAVTARPLSAPGRGDVLGEALLGGSVAVVSTAGLGNLSAPGGIGFYRLATLVLHEIGHLAGLGHCQRAPCAMHRSRDAGDLDDRDPHFCPDCEVRFRTEDSS
jgi:hypothetical protein